MSQAMRSNYGESRFQAFAALSGPDELSVQGSDEFGFGTRVLSLIEQHGTIRAIARGCTVYVQPGPTAEHGILRSVAFDVADFKAVPSPAPVGRRTVWIPTVKIREWVEAFGGVTVRVAAGMPESGERQRCRRLELCMAALCSRTELAWVVDHPDFADMDRAWERVWEQMEGALGRSAVLSGLTEHYSDPAVHPHYTDD